MSLLNLLKPNHLSSSSIEFLPEGYAKIPWQDFSKQNKIYSENFVVKDPLGNYIPAQLFQIDREDPSHNFVAISLRDIPSETEELSKFIESLEPKKEKESPIQNRGFPRLEVIRGPNDRPRGVKLASGKLTVWFNLIPDPEDNNRNWYSGSATSVLLDNQEMLEYFTNEYISDASKPYWMCHDPEKRCMQIDKIQVRDNPENAWSKTQTHNLFDQTYELISHSIGQVGVSITIASTPFSYNEGDKGNKCRLYRVISLFKDADYVLEELFVRKIDPKSGKSIKDGYLEFKAHYFTFMDLHFRPVPMEHPSQKLFAVISTCSPYPAYGFMTLSNTSESGIEYPTTDFPEWLKKHRTFSWGISGCQYAECLHRLTFTFDHTLPEVFPEVSNWQKLSS